MDVLITLFGEGKDLNALQMGDRTVVVFFLALAMIRIAGRRSFGMKSSFDNVIVILLGAILSRAVVGVSPFIPTTCACFILVMLHRLIGWVTMHKRRLRIFFKGDKRLLYKDGTYFEDNMRHCMICKEEIIDQVQKQLNTRELTEVEAIFMHSNGEVSILKKKS